MGQPIDGCPQMGPQMGLRSGGGVGGLSTNNFWRTPAWNELRKLDFDGRLAAIKDEATRAKLVQDVKDDPQASKNLERTQPDDRFGLVDLRALALAP